MCVPFHDGLGLDRDRNELTKKGWNVAFLDLRHDSRFTQSGIQELRRLNKFATRRRIDAAFWHSLETVTCQKGLGAAVAATHQKVNEGRGGTHRCN